MPEHPDGFFRSLADRPEAADPGGLDRYQADMAVDGNVGIPEGPDPLAAPVAAVHAVGPDIHVLVAQSQGLFDGRATDSGPGLHEAAGRSLSDPFQVFKGGKDSELRGVVARANHVDARFFSGPRLLHVMDEHNAQLALPFALQEVMDRQSFSIHISSLRFVAPHPPRRIGNSRFDLGEDKRWARSRQVLIWYQFALTTTPPLPNGQLSLLLDIPRDMS